jgi:enterochelin esterase-like enzyme
MGSAMAFRAYCERLDLFAWLGMFIGGLTIKREEYDFTDLFENNFDELAKKTKLFFASNGEEEPTSKTMPADMDALKARGMNTEYHTYPGGHEFTVCRESLRDLAQKLFR